MMLFGLPILVLSIAVIGGIASAIVGGGREDNPVWLNLAVGSGALVVVQAVAEATGGKALSESFSGLVAVFVVALVLAVLVRQVRSRYRISETIR